MSFLGFLRLCQDGCRLDYKDKRHLQVEFLAHLSDPGAVVSPVTRGFWILDPRGDLSRYLDHLPQSKDMPIGA